MKPTELLTESKARCIRSGLDPGELPAFSDRVTASELQARRTAFQEVLDVTNCFIDKFLSAAPDDPLLILLTDAEGCVLALRGNAAMERQVRQFGIEEGVKFTEDMGPSSIALSLSCGQPVLLLGEDHFHEALYDVACCTALLRRDAGATPAGTLTFMTELADAHPHLLALLCATADSIERELLQRRRNEQLHMLNQALIENKHYGVVVTDGAGVVVECNKVSVGMLGPALGPGVSALSFEPIAAMFRHVLEERTERMGAELALTGREPFERAMLDVVPIFDGAGRLVRVFGLLRDMTERHKTEELLRNTEKLVVAGQLAVGIAHEVRNPLTTVKGLLQYSKSFAEPAYYDLIMSELDRMNLIVSEFMILGKPEAPSHRPIDAMAVLRELLAIFDTQASRNGVEIVTTGVDELPLSGDPNQLKQVYLNVLKNAMDALPFGGRIDIRFETSGGERRIRFADDGEGMSEETLRRIGEPFFTTKPEGNGLGMMIVKRIVASHGGRLSIESEVGRGTVVELAFPGEGPAE
ncbi:ATP-binding protein [Paenibacillus sp.]|uniref:ATP-binding protein n=1 Tax=Paenibacillus sp. TaxID=58172 RepID=UPI002810C8FE|nr:ATP-binding protein [Paenibacillus sp.]